MAEIFGPNLDEYEKGERDRLTQEVDQLLEEIQEAENRVELSAEVIAQNQKLYDELGIEIDLAEEARLGHILTPTPEQAEAISAAQYDLPVIIDGRLWGQETISLARKYFTEKYHRTGVYLWAQNEKTVPLNSPQGLYLAYFRSEEDVDKAQPELPTGKTFPEYLSLLKTLQEQNPILGLEGLTLKQYLLGQVAQDLQGKHFEANKWTWLLKELIVNDQNIAVRCLSTDWVYSGILVGSDDASGAFPGRGARLAAVTQDSSLPYFPISSPKETKFARNVLKRAFGGDLARYLSDDDLHWQRLYRGLTQENNRQPSILAQIISSGRTDEFREKLFGRYRDNLLLRPAERPPGEGLLRPAHEVPQETNPDNLLRPSEEPEEKRG